MLNHLKIIVVVVFFVFLKSENIYGKSYDLRSNLSTQIKQFGSEKQDLKLNKSVIHPLNIKRKGKATENVVVKFFFKGLSEVSYLESNFLIKSNDSYKLLYKNSLQCKRGPPIL